jgi:hypothetical protein
MSVLLTYTHEMASTLLAAGNGCGGNGGGSGSGGGPVVLNPKPCAPPGLGGNGGPVGTILAWGKWGVIICGLAGLLMCAGKMAIGHRNRATLAADGATGIPWVLGGLSLAMLSAGIVTTFAK